MKLTLHSHLSAKETPSMLHPLYFFAVNFLFVLLLSLPGNLQAQWSLHATSTPGELFFRLNPNNPDFFYKFLQHSADYGATFETPALWEGDTIKAMMYDRGQDLLITFGWEDTGVEGTGPIDSCYTFSYDKGASQVDGPRIVHLSAEIGPVSTEFCQGHYWSTTTLASWQAGDGINGWWPPVAVGKRIAGWSPGEAWGLSWENYGTVDDTTPTLWHYTDYDDHIAEFLTNTAFNSDGKLVRGFAPGEMYYFNGYIEWDPEYAEKYRLFVTTDTGRTWEARGVLPVKSFYEYQFEAIYGWASGELILLAESTYPYTPTDYKSFTHRIMGRRGRLRRVSRTSRL